MPAERSWFRPDSGGGPSSGGDLRCLTPRPTSVRYHSWSTYLFGASFTHGATCVTLVRGTVQRARLLRVMSLLSEAGWRHHLTLVHGTRQPPSPYAGVCARSIRLLSSLAVGRDQGCFDGLQPPGGCCFCLGFQLPAAAVSNQGFSFPAAVSNQGFSSRRLFCAGQSPAWRPMTVEVHGTWRCPSTRGGVAAFRRDLSFSHKGLFAS